MENVEVVKPNKGVEKADRIPLPHELIMENDSVRKEIRNTENFDQDCMEKTREARFLMPHELLTISDSGKLVTRSEEKFGKECMEKRNKPPNLLPHEMVNSKDSGGKEIKGVENFGNECTGVKVVSCGDSISKSPDPFIKTTTQ